jgi:hypothetical protein
MDCNQQWPAPLSGKESYMSKEKEQSVQGTQEDNHRHDDCGCNGQCRGCTCHTDGD